MGKETTIKRRIGSVKNTRQITKAMELVAASKMKKAQVAALRTRDYRKTAGDILSRLSWVSDVKQNPLFDVREVKNHLIIFISSDLGLAGGYDSNVMKHVTKILTSNKQNKIKSLALPIGRKAGQFGGRLTDLDIVSAYSMFSNNPTPADIRPIITEAIRKYQDSEVDKVSVVYTEFISNLNQEVKTIDLLPASVEHDVDEKRSVSELEVAIFEPNIAEIVDDAVLRLIEVQLWQAILESLASEYSMRMIAMKNASDNANDIIDDLTLAYNTARQSSITQEIAEIVGGAEAVAAK